MPKKILLLIKEKNIYSIPIIIIAFFPVFLLTGSLIINFFIILLDVIFLIEIFKTKKFSDYKNLFFIFLLLFFFSLIINIFLNTGDRFSFERQIGFVRFFIFVFAIKYYLSFKSDAYFNDIIKIWSIIFVVVTFDIFFEFIFGFNIFGNKSYMPGRISSFLGDELKIGNFYNGFIFIIASYFLIKKKLSIYNIFLILVFFSAAFVIGERANFLKILIGFIIFILFSKEFKPKIVIVSLLSIIFLIIGSTNKQIKIRINQIFVPINEMGLANYIKTSHYGAHYDTAYKIFKNNKIFGIGLKEFRYESRKEIYKDNKNNIYKRDNWATHPHQVHFEILSETGLFGYFIFISFFLFSILKGLIRYFKNKNIYLLSSLTFVITSLLPLIPSGSFFTTFGATIFWLNFSFLVKFCEKKVLTK
tara:strand:- start:10963 stop:12213 length:1251 start_codon:yes stop_codon:yes gene_type:complete